MARQAYDSILTQLRQDQDEVAVFTFDASLHERQDFTRDLGEAEGRVDDFRARSARHPSSTRPRRPRGKLAARSATHKAIIVLTDGIDTSSAMTAREVSGLASSIDVPVFVVATVPSIDQRLMLRGIRTVGTVQCGRPARSG